MNSPGYQSQLKTKKHAQSFPPKKKQIQQTKTSLPAWSKALLPSLSLNSLVCAVLFDGSLTQLLGGDVFVEWPGHVTVTQPSVLYVHWVTRRTWENSCNLSLLEKHKYMLHIDFILSNLYCTPSWHLKIPSNITSLVAGPSDQICLCFQKHIHHLRRCEATPPTKQSETSTWLFVYSYRLSFHEHVVNTILTRVIKCDVLRHSELECLGLHLKL